MDAAFRPSQCIVDHSESIPSRDSALLLHTELGLSDNLRQSTELGAKSPDVPSNRRAREVTQLLGRIEAVVRFIAFTV